MSFWLVLIFYRWVVVLFDVVMIYWLLGLNVVWLIRVLCFFSIISFLLVLVFYKWVVLLFG